MMLVSFLLVVAVAFGNCQKRDLCNWQYDSTYSRNESSPGVIPVELRCLKGYLEWKLPNGGLQVKFRTPVELLGTEFTVSLISKKTTAIFYEETANNGLKILRSSEKYNPKSAITLKSRNGEAGLYLAVHPNDNKNPEKNSLRIDYELEGKEDLSMLQDCRMCSVEEMAELFCKGDYAVKAKVQNKFLHNDGINVYLDLHVYHLFHQSSQVFLKSYEGSYHIGRVIMGGKCSPPKGRHHYMFLGHVKPQLASAKVDCYLKFGLWKRIRGQIKCKGSEKKKRENSSHDIKDVFYATEL